MKSFITTLIYKEEGATALEYGLLAALIAGIIAGTVQVIGTEINTVFTQISALINAAPS